MSTRRPVLALLGDGPTLATAAACAAAFGLAWWALFVRADPAAHLKPKPTSVTHMHCPVCRDEVPYNPDVAQGTCPACDAGAAYEPTIGSIHEAGRGRWMKPTAAAALGAVLALGLTHVAVRRARTLRRRDDAVRHRKMVMPCPFCNRRVSFPASKCGTGHVCSGCKTAFVLESDLVHERDEPRPSPG